MFVHSENKQCKDIGQLLRAEKVVLYTCIKMQKSPTLAPLWEYKICRRISALYVDEAHTIHKSCIWHPAYANLFKLCQTIEQIMLKHGETMHIPLICLSATCPASYCQLLVMYAGLNPKYELINLGNHHPELSHAVKFMTQDLSSFKDIAFMIPAGCHLPDLPPPIGYTDDLELLTKWFW